MPACARQFLLVCRINEKPRQAYLGTGDFSYVLSKQAIIAQPKQAASTLESKFSSDEILGEFLSVCENSLNRLANDHYFEGFTKLYRPPNGAFSLWSILKTITCGFFSLSARSHAFSRLGIISSGFSI